MTDTNRLKELLADAKPVYISRGTPSGIESLGDVREIVARFLRPELWEEHKPGDRFYEHPRNLELEIEDALEEADELVQALRESGHLQGPWRPIEELPEEYKDGRGVLVYYKVRHTTVPEYSFASVSHWESGCWQNREFFLGIATPTHFRELGPLPNTGGER